MNIDCFCIDSEGAGSTRGSETSPNKLPTSVEEDASTVKDVSNLARRDGSEMLETVVLEAAQDDGSGDSSNVGNYDSAQGDCSDFIDANFAQRKEEVKEPETGATVDSEVATHLDEKTSCGSITKLEKSKEDRSFHEADTENFEDTKPHLDVADAEREDNERPSAADAQKQESFSQIPMSCDDEQTCETKPVVRITLPNNREAECCNTAEGNASFEHELSESSDEELNVVLYRSRIPRPAALKPGVRFHCVVRHIERCDIVYISKVPVVEVGPLQEDVSYFLPLQDFDPETPCMAQFSEDNKWYRAEVKEYFDDEQAALVFYVDYGLCEVVPVHDRLRVLTEEFCQRPALAVKCKLALMPAPGQMPVDESVVLEAMAALIGSQEIVCCVEQLPPGAPRDMTPVVHLFTTVVNPDGKEQLALVVDQLFQVLQTAFCPVSA